jgi:hypothetical protein
VNINMIEMQEKLEVVVRHYCVLFLCFFECYFLVIGFQSCIYALTHEEPMAWAIGVCICALVLWDYFTGEHPLMKNV